MEAAAFAAARAITPRDIMRNAVEEPGHNPVAIARHTLRTMRQIALSTLDSGSGYPFTSSVSVASDIDGVPVILIFDLAHHTRNLKANNRISLMPLPEPNRIGRNSLAAGGRRLTLVGHAVPAAADITDRIRRRYLACNPKMTLPATLDRFTFWRIEPVDIDVLSFGTEPKMSDIFTNLSGAEELIAAEADLVADLNKNQADLLRRLGARTEGGEDGRWAATSLDPDGLDLRFGHDVLRVTLDQRVETPAAMLAALTEIAARPPAEPATPANDSD